MKKIKILVVIMTAVLILPVFMGCTAAQEEDPLAGQIQEMEETPDYVVQYNKAFNLASAQQYRASIEKYKKSIDLIEAIDENKRTEKAKMTYRNALLGLGRSYGNIGNLNQAEKYFNKYIERYPNQHKGYLQYGSILEKNGKPEKAKEQYERAMEANPDSAVGEFALANNLRSKGKLEKAVEYYKKGLKKDPEFQEGNGWFQLAKTYEQMGNTDEAIKAYKKLVEIRPENAQAHYLIADKYLSKGLNVGAKSKGQELSQEARNQRIDLYEKAIEHDKKAYNLKPKSNQYKIHLVNSYIKLAEMYAEADPKLHNEYAQKTIPILKQYIEENPNNEVGYSLIADSYFKLKQYQKSINNAEKALEITDTAYAHSILADVYFEIKNWPLAKKHYLKILNNPDYPYAKGRLEIVEKRLRGEY